MRRALPFLAAALAYALVAVFWSAPASLAPTETVPDLGDPLHLSYVMAWDAHQLVRRPAALFESNSFHPRSEEHTLNSSHNGQSRMPSSA